MPTLFRNLILFSSILLLVSTACQDENSYLDSLSPNKSEALGLNDVSILFPYIDLPELIQRAPKIHETRANGGRFIPEESFRRLHKVLVDDNELRSGFSGREGEGASDPRLEKHFFTAFGDYILASVRIDPCANQLAEDDSFTGQCRHELRLVWQVIWQSSSGLRTEDGNLHSIYELTRQEFLQLIAGIQQIKRLASEPMPLSLALGPNPLILAEGAQSKSYDRFIALFSSYATLSRLKTLAALGDMAPNFEGHWPLLALDFEDGEFIPRSLKHLKVSPENQGQEFFVQRVRGAFGQLSSPSPLGERTPSINYRDANTVSQYLRRYQELGDPRVHGVENTDCASCHMSHTALAGAFLPEGVEALTDGFYENSRWNLDLSGTNTRKLSSMQIFSFFPHDYAIAPRAVFESAVVADRIQKLLDEQP